MQRIKVYCIAIAMLLPVVAAAQVNPSQSFTAWAQEQQKKTQLLLQNEQSNVRAILQSADRQKLYLTQARTLAHQTKSVIFPTTSPKRLLVFVSFSMPKESLKQWLSQTQSYGAVLVLRGLVHQSFRETATRIASVLDQGKGGFQIDPESFKRFHVTQVPAVVQVYSNGSYDIVYGDIGLSKAVEQFYQARS